MEKPSYTIWDLCCYWKNFSEDDIEQLLITGKLKPSICLKSTPLALLDKTGTTITSKTEKHGMFELIGYEKINWNYSWQANATFCDPYKDKIRLLQNGEVYGFNTGHSLNKDEILITREEVERWEKEHSKEPQCKKPDYMNLDHACYSEELADAVKAWEYTVKQGTDPKKFKAIAKEWLEQRGYKGAALDRLAVVVNPDEGKGGGAPKREP